MLQLLLVMWALEHGSVFLLLCWVTTAPLLLSVTRASDVAKKRWLVPLPSKQWPWVAAAAAGLGEAARFPQFPALFCVRAPLNVLMIAAVVSPAAACSA